MEHRGETSQRWIASRIVDCPTCRALGVVVNPMNQKGDEVCPLCNGNCWIDLDDICTCGRAVNTWSIVKNTSGEYIGYCGDVECLKRPVDSFSFSNRYWEQSGYSE